MVSCCSYLLPMQYGRTSPIKVNQTQLQTTRVTLYTFCWAYLVQECRSLQKRWPQQRQGLQLSSWLGLGSRGEQTNNGDRSFFGLNISEIKCCRHNSWNNGFIFEPSTNLRLSINSPIRHGYKVQIILLFSSCLASIISQQMVF